jgi:hypothetical protein
MDERASDGVPQFTTAEYAPAGAPPSTRPACAACGRAVGDPHYRINGRPVCAACTERVQRQVPVDSHERFLRALLFGVGGAIAGFALYVIFAIATGLVVGWVSLAVGYLVGKAMSTGSGGVGGRRYQIAALALTYAAVSLSAVPIAIHYHPLPGMAANVGRLIVLGLASPFLELSDPVHGIIGLIILLVGLRIAWRLTAAKAVDIVGPIHESRPVSAAPI